MDSMTPIPGDSLKDKEEKDTRFLIEQYHVISNNRLQHNELVWNFQLVFITAQAFLLILAVGGFVQNSLANAIGAFCGFVFGFMSYQAFERSRIMEIADAELLLNIEKDFKLHDYKGIKAHHKPQTYNYLNGSNVYDYLDSKGYMRFLNRGSSYELWKCGMQLVMLVELLLFAYHLFVFGLKGCSGNIPFYGTYDVFRESISNAALSSIFAIFAINWAEFMVFLVLKSQLKNESKEEKKLRKDIQRVRATFYIIQLGLIVVVYFISLLDYLGKISDCGWIWLVLIVACACCVLSSALFTRIKSNILTTK